MVWFFVSRFSIRNWSTWCRIRFTRVPRDRGSCWPGSRPRVGVERVVSGWVRWKEIAWLVTAQGNYYSRRYLRDARVCMFTISFVLSVCYWLKDWCCRAMRLMWKCAICADYLLTRNGNYNSLSILQQSSLLCYSAFSISGAIDAKAVPPYRISPCPTRASYSSRSSSPWTLYPDWNWKITVIEWLMKWNYSLCVYVCTVPV